MKTHFLPVLFVLLAATLSVSNSVYADEINQVSCVEAQSYGDRMGEKALNGFVNMNTAILEMPKNTINTINDSNFVLGLIGGAIKGALNTAGRMTAGLADLMTFWLPTQPISQPGYVWDDFDADTTYGKTFRLQKNKQPCNEK